MKAAMTSTTPGSTKSTKAQDNDHRSSDADASSSYPTERGAGSQNHNPRIRRRRDGEMMGRSKSPMDVSAGAGPSATSPTSATISTKNHAAAGRSRGGEPQSQTTHVSSSSLSLPLFTAHSERPGTEDSSTTLLSSHHLQQRHERSESVPLSVAAVVPPGGTEQQSDDDCRFASKTEQIIEEARREALRYNSSSTLIREARSRLMTSSALASKTQNTIFTTEDEDDNGTTPIEQGRSTSQALLRPPPPPKKIDKRFVFPVNNNDSNEFTSAGEDYRQQNQQQQQQQEHQQLQSDIVPLSPTSLSKHMRVGVASFISSQQQSQRGGSEKSISRRYSGGGDGNGGVDSRSDGASADSDDDAEKKIDGGGSNSDDNSSATTSLTAPSGVVVLSGQRHNDTLRNALDRATTAGTAAAARAISEGVAIASRRSQKQVDRPKSVDGGTTPFKSTTILPLIPTGNSPDSCHHNFIENNTGQEDEDDDFFGALHLTRSAEEVLELTKSHINEAQAQIHLRPNIPTPHSPLPNFLSIEASASSKNYHPEILNPTISPGISTARDFIEQQRDSDNTIAANTPLPPKTTDTKEFFNSLATPSASELALYDDLEAAVKMLPGRLRKSLSNEDGQLATREQMLRTLDGIHPSPAVSRNPSMKSNQSDLSYIDEGVLKYNIDDDGDDYNESENRDAASMVGTISFGSTVGKGNSRVPNPTIIAQRKAPKKPVIIKSMEVAQQPQKADAIKVIYDFIMGQNKDSTTGYHDGGDGADIEDGAVDDQVNNLLSKLTQTVFDQAPIAGESAVLPGSRHHKHLPSFSQLVKDAADARQADPRMPEWVDNKFIVRENLPKNGTYQLGESKTIIVHEILRGHWTWCTCWSPDGVKLAIATDNHHLAVVDTTSSCVWRVRHDRKAVGPPKNGATNSIRSIAWGDNYIAVGGTGNAVSILAPVEPYPILHTITPTGFVGSLDFLPHTNTLLVGSRLGKAVLFNIWAKDEQYESSQARFSGSQVVREIQSAVVHMVDRGKAWVNCVKFNPHGKYFAVGDSFGILGIYSLMESKEEQTYSSTDPITWPIITNIANFKLEDSILDVEWAADGDFLYAGGEDFAITIISTQYWEPVHRIARDRWVQFISSSHGATHVAVGGIASEVSLLDVGNGWDNVINISLKGLVPLSAKWHPQDQYLVLTGQNNSVLAIETTNARHVFGHFVRSFHAIRAIAFSPDGRMVAIGNEMGVVTIFKLTATTFLSAYEMVADCNGPLSIEWSMNGAYVVISATNKVVVVARREILQETAPPKTSGFFVANVIRGLGDVQDLSIDPTSRFVAASGNTTKILDASSGFKTVLEIENGGMTLVNSWSFDGKWFAAAGKDHSLVIYDTSHVNLEKWKSVFTVKMSHTGLALSWSPLFINGLQYLAYGGEDRRVNILEIRTEQRTWENVLSVPRDGNVNDLDWNADGLVAAAIGNGTVSILDLSYLQTGRAVNEMDYNWQRQALTCFTEVRRNRGKHEFRQVAWIPSSSAVGTGTDSLLAIGGTDGEVEIVDLTERKNCRGFGQRTSSSV